MTLQENLSPWRFSEVRVDVSLTPRQYGKGSVHARRAAEKKALKSFFMTYNTLLGGVPVAQHGPLRFPDEEIRFIDESPYAHVTAEFNTLLFAPQPGSILTGEVVHIGADHVGLTVFGAFHAVISKDNFFSNYKYVFNSNKRWWKYTGKNVAGRANVEIGKWLKFSVLGVRPARGGLFNINGTVRCGGDGEGDMGTDNKDLGFIEPEKEVDLLNGGVEELNDVDNDVENLFADDAGFNDDLGHLLDDDLDKAPLAESPTKVMQGGTKLTACDITTPKSRSEKPKKKKRTNSDENRKKKRKSPGDGERDTLSGVKSKVRAGSGEQVPDGEEVDVAQAKSMKSKRRKLEF